MENEEQEPTLEELLEQLKDKEPDSRRVAAETLSSHKESFKVIDSLKAAIQCEKSNIVRSSLHYHLKKIEDNYIDKMDKSLELLNERIVNGDIFAIIPYVNLFCEKIVPWVVYWDDYEPENTLLNMSVKSVDDEELERLKNLLYSNKDCIACLALFALGGLADRRAAGEVLSKIREKGIPFSISDGIVSEYQFVKIVLKMDALEELAEIYKDKPELIAATVSREDGGFEEKHVRRIIEKMKDESEYLAKLIEELYTSDAINLELILPLLNHTSKKVRRSVIDILGKLGDKNAVEPLTKALANEADKMIRNQIMETINSLKES